MYQEIIRGTFFEVVREKDKAVKHLLDFGFDHYKNEIIFLKKIDHKNIVKMISYSEEKKTIDLELCDCDLVEFFEKEKVNEINNKEYYLQILDALEYIHSLNICHLDVKPDNILWKKSEKRLKLSDFGNSRYIGENRKVNFGGLPHIIIPSILWDFKKKYLKTTVYFGVHLDLIAFVLLLSALRNSRYFYLKDYENEKEYFQELYEDKLIEKIYMCNEAKELRKRINDFF
jgi:serine/threonine protein kinase